MIWPFKKKPEEPKRRVFLSEGEGWRSRVAWQDQSGKLWVRSIDDGWEIWLELIDGGEVRPASNSALSSCGPSRRWRDAPALRPADPREG